MPPTYYVDPDRRLVLTRPTGRFTETTLIALCQAIYDDPDREPQFSTVWDVREVDELVMDASVIPMYRAFLAENAGRITQGQIAVITDREMATTFASMLIEIGRAKVGAYEIFSDLPSAATWLDVPTEALSDPPAPRPVRS
jgi:hypothetical protein